jgi:hypothetical protein
MGAWPKMQMTAGSLPHSATDPHSDRALSSSSQARMLIRWQMATVCPRLSPPNPGLARRADKIKPAYLSHSFFIEATLICRQAIGRAEPHSPKTMDDETE